MIRLKIFFLVGVVCLVCCSMVGVSEPVFVGALCINGSGLLLSWWFFHEHPGAELFNVLRSIIRNSYGGIELMIIPLGSLISVMLMWGESVFLVSDFSAIETNQSLIFILDPPHPSIKPEF